MNWLKRLRQDEVFSKIKGRVRFQEPLKKHTTFKVGGPAKLFIEPGDHNDLRALLNLARKYKIPFFLIGRGSNILIGDKELNGMVLRLNSPYFRRLSYKNNCLDISSGVSLNRLVCFAKKRGLSGAEFLSGIPGTIAGALAMNAGVSEKVKSQKSPPQIVADPPRLMAKKVKSIGDLVKTVKVADYDGNIKTLDRKEIKFGYRTTDLSKYIILSASIKLVKKSKKEIDNKIKKYLHYRKLSQDLSKPSAGCVFKNPIGYSAGRLIDLCGLKGAKVGGASISERHANFIVNLGNATSKDILRLMGLVKKRVREQFSVNLEPEIKIWK